MHGSYNRFCSRGVVGVDPELEVRFHRHPKPQLVKWLGNEFTIVFRALNGPAMPQPCDRIWFLLEPSERRRMRLIDDEVVDALLRLPGDPTDPLDQMLVEMSLGLAHRGWLARHEIWLRYRTQEDLAEWVAFLRDILPRCVDRCRDRWRRARG